VDAFWVKEDGTKEHPILVWQTGYSCGHATRNPKPEKGQYYRTVGFLDMGDPCPDCVSTKEMRKMGLPT